MRTFVEAITRPHHDHATGGLRSCGDGRFVGPTRHAFEEVTGLGSDDYYHFSNAGGVAVPHEGGDLSEDDLVSERGVRIRGWQGHLNQCGGKPGMPDDELARQILQGALQRVDRYPDANHHILIASLGSVDSRPSTTIDVYTPAEARRFLKRTNIPVSGGTPRRVQR